MKNGLILNGKKYHSNHMAAFGLVLKHYGKIGITELIKIWNRQKYTNFDLNKVDDLGLRLYSNGFGKKIDSIDNGQYMEHIFVKDKNGYFSKNN